jgi:hypothetical protein
MKVPVALVLLFAVTAFANDLTGKWSGTFKADGADHTIPQLFVFQQDGKKLTGTGGPDSREQYPIENGIADGDRVKFELTTGEWKFTYDLKKTGPDTLNGAIVLKSVDESRTATVSLIRKPEK